MRAAVCAAAVGLVLVGCGSDGATTQSASATQDSADLSGEWESSDYECARKKDITERVRITQDGNRISAVKITGDDCVKAGHETFTGTITGTTGIVGFWLGQPGGQPVQSPPDTKLTVKDADTLVLSGPADYTFTRV